MYEGFGPTFAAEKLRREHGIKIHGETLRLWLKTNGIPYPSRRAHPHRSWRQRKSCLGDGMDGHFNFAKRGHYYFGITGICVASLRLCVEL